MKYIILSIVVLLVFTGMYLKGKKDGYNLSQSKWLTEFTYQSKQIDTLNIRVLKLKKTHDSLKVNKCH